jgi:hypothetical protein
METAMSEKSTRVSGWKCRTYVQNLIPFHNSGSNIGHPMGATLWGERQGDSYVVYSYGRHWPLYVNWRGIWFSNRDKYSPTTSKHASQANPLVNTVPLPKIDLEYLVLFEVPHDNDLIEAAKLNLLPEDLIPMAAAKRIGG